MSDQDLRRSISIQTSYTGENLHHLAKNSCRRSCQQDTEGGNMGAKDVDWGAWRRLQPENARLLTQLEQTALRDDVPYLKAAGWLKLLARFLN